MSFKESEVGLIPDEWEAVKIGDIADILSGYAFKAGDFVSEGVPVIKIKNIIPPKVDIEDAQFISQELADEKSRFKLKFNDILISLTGSNINQFASAVGKVGRVKIKNTNLMLNQRVGKFEIKDDNIFNEDFLYYYISTDEVRWMLASSAGGSANQANISPKQIKDLFIPCPPIKEQKAISEILVTFDEQIETNNQLNKRLEQMAQAIYKQWFVDFEFPNDKGEPYKSTGGLMIDTELGQIPVGWKSSNVLDNVVQVSEKNKSKRDIPVLSVVKEGKFVYSEDYFTKQVYSKDRSNYKIVRKYDVGYNPSRANIGSIAMLKEFDEGLLSPMYGIFRIKETIKPYYFDYYMKRPGFIEKIAHNSSGTTRQNFDFNAFKTFDIVIPPLEIQEKAYKIISNLEKQVVNNNKQNKVLAEMRDALLPKLMSGEIRVSLDSGI